MAPTTRNVLRRQGGGVVRFSSELIPSQGSSDVLIRVRAVSLNYKDVAMVDDRFPFAALKGAIVGTEFAGEVVSVGDKVRLFEAGDRVVSLMNYDDITGRESTFQGKASNIDGSLAEYLVVPEIALAKIPAHLTWNEASMIPCSGLTAWSALMGTRLSGKTVLIQVGTGGTSIIALLLAVKAGAAVIITSSSDEKLERAKKLGATHTINYNTHPDWEAEALKLTGGQGVDVVIEQGGAGTLVKSVTALKKCGKVQQCGFLSSAEQGDLSAMVQMLIFKVASVVGVRVGLKPDLEDMMEYLGATQLELAPCIDSVYDFSKVEEAIERVRSGKMFGKVIVHFP
ncbi:NAD(P)-binding protein [Thozetella sp. PMI_491]|nr:NAD(P)-binding protein [Thozetella sp. PMI_491]